MQPGLTQHWDLAQVAFWAFALLFVGVCWWNRLADKREGYPLKTSPFDATRVLGIPVPPEEPWRYQLLEGGETRMPHDYDQPPMRARPLHGFDGTPLAPVGNPLLSPLGAGAWVMRRDEPMLTEDGEPMLQPLRRLPEWSIEQVDTDPRGMRVFDWRWLEVGVVRDVWVDQSIKIVRILEVELQPGLAPGNVILAPIFHADIRERAREVHLLSLRRHQFAELPMPASPDVITAREDDRLNAYWAGGKFYRDSDATDPRGGVAP